MTCLEFEFTGGTVGNAKEAHIVVVGIARAALDDVRARRDSRTPHLRDEAELLIRGEGSRFRVHKKRDLFR